MGKNKYFISFTIKMIIRFNWLVVAESMRSNLIKMLIKFNWLVVAESIWSSLMKMMIRLNWLVVAESMRSNLIKMAKFLFLFKKHFSSQDIAGSW